MKRLLFVFGLLIAGVTVQAQTATATTQQSQPTAKERAHNQALRMQKTLALSEAQTTQVEQVCLTSIQKIDAIKADASKSKEVKDQEIAQARNDKDAQIMAILTPEQVTKYKEMKAQRQQRKAAASGQE